MSQDYPFFGVPSAPSGNSYSQDGSYSHGYGFPQQAQPGSDHPFHQLPDEYSNQFWPIPQFSLFPPSLQMPLMPGVQGMMPMMPMPTGSMNMPSAASTTIPPTLPGLNFLSSVAHPRPNAAPFVPDNSKANNGGKVNQPSKKENGPGSNSKPGAFQARDPNASALQTSVAKPVSITPKLSNVPVKGKQLPAQAQTKQESDLNREAAATFVSLLIFNGYTLADIIKDPTWTNNDKKKLSKLFNDVKANRVIVPPIVLEGDKTSSQKPVSASSSASSTAHPDSSSTKAVSAASTKPPSNQTHQASISASPAQTRLEYLAKLKAAKARAVSSTGSKIASQDNGTGKGEPATKTSSSDAAEDLTADSSAHKAQGVAPPLAPDPDSEACPLSGPDPPSVALSTTATVVPPQTQPDPTPASAQTAQNASDPETRKRIQTELARQRLLALAKSRSGSVQSGSATPAVTVSSLPGFAPKTTSSLQSTNNVPELSIPAPPLVTNSEALEGHTVSSSTSLSTHPAHSVANRTAPVTPTGAGSALKRSAVSDSDQPEPKRPAPFSWRSTGQLKAPNPHFDEPFIIEASDESSEEGEISDSESLDGVPQQPSSFNSTSRPSESNSVFHSSGGNSDAALPKPPNQSQPQLLEMEMRIAQLKRDIERREAEARAAAAAAAAPVSQETPVASAAMATVPALPTGLQTPSPVFTPEYDQAECKQPKAPSDPFLSTQLLAAHIGLPPKPQIGPPPQVLNSQVLPFAEKAADMSDGSSASMAYSSSESESTSSSNSESESGSGSESESESESTSASPSASSSSSDSISDSSSKSEFESVTGSDSGSASRVGARTGPLQVLTGPNSSPAEAFTTLSVNAQGRQSSSEVVNSFSPIPAAESTGPDYSRTIVARTYTPATSHAFSSFTPYDSPLQFFRSFRFHSEFLNSVRGGYRSLTYSNSFDPNVILCPFDVSGICADPNCRRGQHWKDATLTDEALIVQLGTPNPDWNEDMSQQWTAALAKALEYVSSQQVTNADFLLSYIVFFRKKFLGDNTRVVTV